jgi:hypothetical protein
MKPRVRPCGSEPMLLPIDMSEGYAHSYGVPRGLIPSETYGLVPAGATVEVCMPILSSARRTLPEAMAASTKALA